MAPKSNAAQSMEQYAAENGTEEGILEYSSNIEDAERPPVLPVGEYRATVTGVEKKFGKESNRPYLNLKFRIEPDAMPADFVEAIGTNDAVTVFYMAFVAEDTPQSKYNMKQLCRALGAPMGNRINVTEFVNREAIVTIRHGKDLEGNPTAQVGNVKAA